MSRGFRGVKFLFASLAMLALAGAVCAQGLFKYRDAEGNWVFTDRRPDDGRAVEELPLADPVSVPEITVTRRLLDERVELVATNDCFCPAEIALRLLLPEGAPEQPEEIVHRVIPARRETVLGAIDGGDASVAAAVGYEYRAVLGEPTAKHNDGEVYRAPFAVARTFPVTQAYPASYTHVNPASAHAVDLGMPVGTQIYAARAGTVIEVASRYFEGAADPEKAMRANIVRVLHPDGTLALYAHLNWDSIRVRPGQIVRRGEYIADSGNTGFTTGPHLHFVVQRNAGLRLESVPIVFAGRNGERITPATGESITAY